MASLNIQQEAPPAPPPPPPLPPAPAAQQGKGIYAVVLYDYEADEENEMSLTEGEMIEQIEEIDEGEPAFSCCIFLLYYTSFARNAPCYPKFIELGILGRLVNFAHAALAKCASRREQYTRIHCLFLWIIQLFCPRKKLFHVIILEPRRSSLDDVAYQRTNHRMTVVNETSTYLGTIPHFLPYLYPATSPLKRPRFR